MKETLRKIFYILPERDSIRIFILFLMMMIAAGLEVAGIGMIPAFVSIVASPDQVLDYELTKPLLSFLSIDTAQELLIWGSVILVGIFVLKSTYILFFNFIEARFIFNRRYKLSHRMMTAYMQAPYTFHLRRNTAELLRNITQEINIFVSIVVTQILTMAREGIMTISILGFLFLMEPLITLIVIAISGLGAGSFIFFARIKLKKYGIEQQGYRGEMIRAVNQGLGGIKDSRVLNREPEFIEKFRSVVFKSSKLGALTRFIKQIPKPLVETSAVIGMMIISALMVWQGRSMVAIVPILTLFAMAIVRLMPAVQTLSSMYTNLKYNMVSIDPIYDDLKELEESSAAFRKDRENRKKMELKDKIEAKDISYSYPDSNEQALKEVSFTIEKNKAVAFVGASGAGKTTVVDLLLGLMKPTKGEILVDGVNIHKNLSAWQRNIGYIPQSIYMADETMRNNIAFGVPENEIEDDKLMLAVESAQLTDVVERLPKGLNTIIGENGTRLSGGQRQRVGIARALYHSPQVLVMDEATSALDNITEKEITRSIESLIGERTIIIIAHRLTTVQNCDVIYLMKNGKIVDKGTYNELVNKNSEFRKMALINE